MLFKGIVSRYLGYLAAYLARTRPSSPSPRAAPCGSQIPLF